MEYIWSPWRYQFVTGGIPSRGCIFCTARDETDRDAENLVVYRGRRNFVIVNRFPYTSGHLMIAPYEHVDSLGKADEETATEMILLARRAEAHLRALYKPEGLNLGMNEGKCAGAGVADHIHLHVLPRWVGDSNFMSVVGETRLLPEELSITYERLRGAFGRVP